MTMEREKIRVMLVDDHAVVRVGFRMLLSLNPDIEVVGEAENGEQAYHRYPEIRPDVLIMDLSMPGMGGIETVRRLVARDPEARVLVLSAHEDTAHPKRVLKAGAVGYLCKRSAPEELIDAVAAIAAGVGRTMSPVRYQRAPSGSLKNPFAVCSGRDQ